MPALLPIDARDERIVASIEAGLHRVERRFSDQLDSRLPPVADLCRHVESYRGKMLRPTLVMLSGLAASDGGALSDDAVTVGAVMEMVHMATLVHDDVLDEADMRRGGRTVNALRGNEAAVILGDYLIARSFHLCSQIDDQRIALRVGAVTSVVCEGELLQLHHRGDWDLDEETYFEIIERKTASLIAAACELGAASGGCDEARCMAFGEYGRRIGLAFQIQDDLLDLLGEASVVGKSLGKDLEKGKLTLPLIHHLATVDPADRDASLTVIRSGDSSGVASLLQRTESVGYAAGLARSYVQDAIDLMTSQPASAARDCLLGLAEAVVTRRR
ncbi:polyprenyl synthetase family protein [Pyruvatibacter sp.]|uniref:polyprenyl synthetase family protein n=1 Tax=Pyruvatibacter sp. TaxID=1981328 RepID=UPI0032EB1AF0